MRPTKAFAIALALFGATACSDGTDPVLPAVTTTITLAPCSLFGLGWFAYQNQGGGTQGGQSQSPGQTRN